MPIRFMTLASARQVSASFRLARLAATTRCFSASRRKCQGETPPASRINSHPEGETVRKYFSKPPKDPFELSSLPSKQARLAIQLDGDAHEFSPLLLRDLCQCPRCVDQSTRQKLFSSTQIPYGISATVEPGTNREVVRLKWTGDIPNFPEDHVTELSVHALRNLVNVACPTSNPELPSKVLWDDVSFREDVRDLDYKAYMSDDSVLHQALQYLHTHGLVFLTNVPEQESSVATIAERIGPVKNTFYGYTWDVRSVPQAKNVAYTSQDLGFHMDLLYMEQPPHLQLLHCIRASSAGGASTFTDSHAAAQDLFQQDPGAFETLEKLPVNFHYDHLESHYYHHARPVFELALKPLYLGGKKCRNVRELFEAWQRAGLATSELPITEWLADVSWSPPFQAPFTPLSAHTEPRGFPQLVRRGPLAYLNEQITRWLPAARKFDELIHRPEGVYERMMKPGECVLFDNRRVLHARKAFEVGDIGKERWLRGAYLDRDPFESRLRVLWEKFGDRSSSAAGA
ncbi:Clavaminate synthase-like protein [Hortaea werneckii]|nr:Clavaminate synthase-like protein [Hortaea werneckii]KAI7026802.1 Clavaminate synthase-like protein [Hortaea werneckii]KAI7672319.1 Clavaminate synthase-like protein [Hortaea werneckii]